MTVEVETTRAGLLGQVAAEIDRIDAQLRDLDDEADRQVEQVRGAAASDMAEALALTVRRQYIDRDRSLRRSREAALQKRADLRDERRDLHKTAEECERWLTANEANEQQDREILAQLDRVYRMLDPNRHARLRDDWRHFAWLRLPQQCDEARSRLRGISARLDELGEE